MAAEVTRARAMLEAWRVRGDDRMDPLRYRFLEALEARARAQTGEARRLLDERLSGLVEAYARDLERSPAVQGLPDAESPQVLQAGPRCADGKSPLGGLLDCLARSAAAGPTAAAEQGTDSRRYPEPPMLDEFRRIWARLRTERQLQASLEPGPDDAGPLNSRVLVHRSLELMQTMSPGYLQHFIAYVDTLLSLEGMHGETASMRGDASRADAARSPARSRRRRR